MKLLKLLFITIIVCFSFSVIGRAEQYTPYPEQTLTFSYGNSYEFADMVKMFAVERKNLSWVSIKTAEKFTKVHIMENIPQIKKNHKYEYRFGGMTGILFDGAGYHDKGFTADAFFYCPVWNGYNRLLLTLNYSPNKAHNSIRQKSTNTFVQSLSDYFTRHGIEVTNIEKSKSSPYKSIYMYSLNISNKAPVYVKLEYWTGSGGALGQVVFNLYFNNKDAFADF